MRSDEQKDPSTFTWKERVTWLCAARACFLSLALLTVTAKVFLYGDSELSDHERDILFKPIAILFGVTALIAWLNTTNKFQRISAFFSITLDTAILGGVVYLSGGPASPLQFLFVVYSLGIAISWGRFAGLAWSIGSASVPLTVNLLLISEIIPLPPWHDLNNFTIGGVVLQGVGLLSAMILVVVAASFLVTRIHKTYAMVEESRRDLKLLREEHRTLESKLALQEKMAHLLASSDESIIGKPRAFRDFIGESDLMKGIFKLISRAATTDATVLVSGESGTGKELVARALHSASARADKPFIAVNCGAIPENLIESELFGHKKGSFTGATTDSIGLFRQANGGTIFLDELGELPASMQVKLLRVLQEQSVRPVGSPTDLPINVRIIAATNRNLKKEVKEGRFREDLFYRVNVINIHLPPLRERKEDIPALVSSFIKRLSKDNDPPQVSPSALDMLTSYGYPGNVRELENILERAIVLGPDVITPEHLPDYLYSTISHKNDTQILCFEDLTLPVDLDKILEMVEKRYIEIALEKTGGAKKRAADLLGINFRSFRYRLAKFKDLEAGDEL